MALYEVTATTALVMSKPSVFSTVLTILSKATQIDVLSITNGWAYFKYNSKSAYTKSSNLKLVQTGSITIKYIDESTLLNISTAKVNSNLAIGTYSYSAITVTGYTLSSTSPQSVTLTSSNLNQTITFKYKKNATNGSITIKYINQTTLAELSTAQVISNLAFGTYSYNAIAIAGYNVSGNSTQSATITAASPNQTITFNYTEILGTVIVKYLDKTSLYELLPTETFSNLKLGSYTYNSKAVAGYTLSGAASQTVTLTADSPTVRVLFSYNQILGSVTVKYIDKDSKLDILTPEVYSDLILDSYNYTAKLFDNYNLADDLVKTVALTESNPNQTVTFSYSNVLCSVTINYIDESTLSALSSPSTINNLSIGTYSYNAISINGYSISGASAQSVTLTKASPNATISFKYNKIYGKVVVKYVDKDSQSDILAADSYSNLALGSYNYSAKFIDGYSLNDDTVKTVSLTSDTPNATVVFNYTRILGSVTINYVDSTSGNSVSPSSTISNLTLGSYSYNAITIDGYSIVGDVTISVTLTSNTPNQSITFKYSKIEIEVPTDLNINEVPYISTYYIKPVVKPGEEVKIDYYITDYYYKEYLEEDFSETFTVTVRVEGQADKTYPNLLAGDHTVSLGSFTVEGEQKFSILCTDKYGRNSHELFNFFLVRNDIVINEYVMTATDLVAYNIKNTDTYEVKNIINLSSLSSKTSATVKAALIDATSKITPASKTYVCVIADTTGDGTPDNWWAENQVKYASDYDKAAVLQEATNTRTGLQKLLDDKKAAGFNKVKLLPGIYRIDHQQQIYIPTQFILDLNGATIKQNQFTGNKSLMMELNNTFDSHVINGTIEGDYFSHDYANSTSNSEWVNCISIGGECKYSAFENINIKDITGYGGGNGIAISRDNKLNYTYLSPKGIGNSFKLGDIDRTTGLNISSTNRTTSDYIDILGYSSIGYLSVSVYLGYQGNPCGTWNIICHFYNENKNFIKSTDAYQYRRVGVPSNARYLRVTILNESYPTNLSVQYFRMPTHCSFNNIKFENCRCVGLAEAAMKDMLVNSCEFTRCGQSSAKCAYDAEDGWDMMQDCTFKNNNFYNNPSNDLLTCAGHNFVIDGQTLGKAYIWERTRSLVIRNCKNVSLTLQSGGIDTIVRHGIYRVYNNTLLDSSVAKNLIKNNICTAISGLAYKCTLSGLRYDSIYDSCTISVSSSTLGMIQNVKLNKCKFIPTPDFLDVYRISFNGGHLDSYSFNNCHFYGKCTLANHVNFYTGKFINCEFDDVTIAPSVNANADDLIYFENCKLNYSDNNLIYYSPAAYSKGTFSQLEFNNCIITNTVNTKKSLLYAYAKPNGYCKFNNCTITLPQNPLIFDGYPTNISYITDYTITFNNCPLPTNIQLISTSYATNTNIKFNITN